MKYEVDIAHADECKVAVAGGGMAGVMAALAAGRAGAPEQYASASSG